MGSWNVSSGKAQPGIPRPCTWHVPYADIGITNIMPTPGLCRAGRGQPLLAGHSGAAMRHNQRASRKASSLSSGRYRPGLEFVAVRRASAFSLSRRLTTKERPVMNDRRLPLICRRVSCGISQRLCRTFAADLLTFLKKSESMRHNPGVGIMTLMPISA